MLRMVVPVDGSDNALRAVEFAVDKLAALTRGHFDLHLLNVQPPIKQGEVRMFVGDEQIREYQEEQGKAALSSACKLLDERDVPYTSHVCVGHASETIANFATEKACDLIVLGTRGLGSVMDMLLGSVAHDLVKESVIPVLLVK